MRFKDQLTLSLRSSFFSRHRLVLFNYTLLRLAFWRLQSMANKNLRLSASQVSPMPQRVLAQIVESNIFCRTRESSYVCRGA